MVGLKSLSPRIFPLRISIFFNHTQYTPQKRKKKQGGPNFLKHCLPTFLCFAFISLKQLLHLMGEETLWFFLKGGLIFLMVFTLP